MIKKPPMNFLTIGDDADPLRKDVSHLRVMTLNMLLASSYCLTKI